MNMKKKTRRIKDLKPGEVFYDSLGHELKVEKIDLLQWRNIPGTAPTAKVWFITLGGSKMYSNFKADREVELK